MRITKSPLPIPMLAFVIIVASCVTTFAQDPQPPQNPLTAATDPIEQLHLMPEQRQKIRAIRESQREERAMINQRLREANFALEQALDADNPDDALIEQRVRDAATAQAASMRMRILTEVRIRRVLTQEQLATLRQLRLQARELIRDQNQNQRPARQGNVLRPNQRNGMAPIFPPRDGGQRNPRP